jgi:hypothetical protein
VRAALLLALLLAAGCKKDAPRCDLAAGEWKQTSPGPCGESTWKFTSRADGTWEGKEGGCAGATGTAHFDGPSLVLDFVYEGGNAKGRYSWPFDATCKPAPGSVSWSSGPLKGQTSTSTLSPKK